MLLVYGAYVSADGKRILKELLIAFDSDFTVNYVFTKILVPGIEYFSAFPITF